MNQFFLLSIQNYLDSKQPYLKFVKSNNPHPLYKKTISKGRNNPLYKCYWKDMSSEGNICVAIIVIPSKTFPVGDRVSPKRNVRTNISILYTFAYYKDWLKVGTEAKLDFINRCNKNQSSTKLPDALHHYHISPAS